MEHQLEKFPYYQFRNKSGNVKTNKQTKRVDYYDRSLNKPTYHIYSLYPSSNLHKEMSQRLSQLDPLPQIKNLQIGNTIGQGSFAM